MTIQAAEERSTHLSADQSPSIEAGDVEKNASVNRTATGEGDGLLVTWDGPNDPSNPLNWSLTRKWAITLLMSFGGLVTLMSGSMMAPALDMISSDLQSDSDTVNMSLSIFVLAFAFGPMVLSPLTEVFGRRIVWLTCASWYIIWNTVCGFAENNSWMLAARFLAGLGASAEFAVTSPVLSDTWAPEQRGYSFSISTFLPLLGPALGPILGGVITSSIGWRWLFWVLSIYDAVLVTTGFFLFPETNGQILLHRKATAMRKETGRAYRTEWEIHSLPLSARLRNGLSRPFMMLATQPTIQLMGVFLAYNFGTLYFVLTSFASLWIDKYHQSTSISGVHYVALVIGYTIASQVGARVTDHLWAVLKERAGGQTAPEYRVPLMIPGVVLIPAGLFWYGWSAENTDFWLVADIGAAVFGCGIIVSTQSMQAYVMDSYRDHVASASAASQFLRSIFAFCFPIFAPALYNTLGYGWGNSLLAFIFLAFGIPAPIILWFYGAKLRAKGKKIT